MSFRLYFMVFIVLLPGSALAQTFDFENYKKGVFKLLTEKAKNDCIDDFKNNMNDPSSFQLAGEWYVDENLLHLTTPESPDMVVGVPIRGKTDTEV